MSWEYPNGSWIGQGQSEQFEIVTRDWQFIHTINTRQETPFGGTIANGLTTFVAGSGDVVYRGPDDRGEHRSASTMDSIRSESQVQCLPGAVLVCYREGELQHASSSEFVERQPAVNGSRRSTVRRRHRENVSSLRSCRMADLDRKFSEQVVYRCNRAYECCRESSRSSQQQNGECDAQCRLDDR